MRKLVLDNILGEEHQIGAHNNTVSHVKMGMFGFKVLNENKRVRLSLEGRVHDSEQGGKLTARATRPVANLDTDSKALRASLVNWRRSVAGSEKVAPQELVTDEQLTQIAKERVSTLEALGKIDVSCHRLCQCTMVSAPFWGASGCNTSSLWSGSFDKSFCFHFPSMLIKGMTQAKVAQYGPRIVDKVKTFLANRANGGKQAVSLVIQPCLPEAED